MATQRILTLSGGNITQAVPITASAGVTSAGSVIAMNASGVLDATMTPAYTGDVTKASGSITTTVTAINGVSTAGLATGILKNTTGTGKPSIAVAGTDYAGINTNNYFGGTMAFNAVTVMNGSLFYLQSASSAPATGATLTLNAIILLLAPIASITGVILSAGAANGQVLTIINNSAFTITFAAVATSRVADGINDVIAATTARQFVWSGSAWFRLA